jgi:hypothetical protein
LFSISAGNGSVTPRSVATGADGRAAARFTLGTIAGLNEVTASVAGVTPAAKFLTTGVAGTPQSVTLGPRPARFPTGVDSLRLSTTAADTFGNRTNVGVAVVSRDPSLISIDASGFAHVRRRGGTTYLVANAGSRSDSVLAIVLAPGDSPCTAIATGQSLALGEVADVVSSGACLRAGTADEEFVLVPYFNSAVPSSTTSIQIMGSGLGALATPVIASSAARTTLTVRQQPDLGFDRTLRAIERREMPRYAAAARAWSARRPSTGSALATRVPANVAVGDLVSFNVNAGDYCANPKTRTARVAAISDHAIVVADTGNPTGGFTDDEYRAIAVTFDTLVNPVDVQAFGQPSDIDGNGRVVMLFSRAVNELSPRGSSSVILGFYFSRDLLPRTSTQGGCAGSNVAEMFYLLVPDPDGAASDPRAKSFVATVTSGTIAHEYQHLINASRRLYVNAAPEIDEEAWLNEGLSHIAEELVFYRSAQLSPGQNLDGTLMSSAAAALQQFQANNLRRYLAYLRATATQAPIGVAGDDDLETRGAAWSLLRYIADRVAPNDENFWFRLVNAKTTGITNLTQAVGSDPAPLVRDWATSVYADDAVSPLDARYAQPSWNMRSLLPATGASFALTDPANERRLTDGQGTFLTLRGGGVAFFRFAVRAGSEALLLVSSGSQPAPPSVQLAVVRIH